MPVFLPREQMWSTNYLVVCISESFKWFHDKWILHMTREVLPVRHSPYFHKIVNTDNFECAKN